MKKLIVANWKLNPVTLQEAGEIFNSIKEELRERPGLEEERSDGTPPRRGRSNSETEVVICPPFVFLSQLDGITLGAQDSYWEEKGAFTGEISVAMLKELGCQYIIVGHSERRKYFQETDDVVNKKTKAIIEAGLTPIVCIGETQEERESDKTEEVLEKEIMEGLKDIDLNKIVIAYEPIWAIGTGNACDVEEAQKMKEVIQKMTSKDAKIIYGGSANASNTEGYLKEAGFDGLLVGGASLKPKEFKQMIKLSA